MSRVPELYCLSLFRIFYLYFYILTSALFYLFRYYIISIHLFRMFFAITFAPFNTGVYGIHIQFVSHVYIFLILSLLVRKLRVFVRTFCCFYSRHYFSVISSYHNYKRLSFLVVVIIYSFTVSHQENISSEKINKSSQAKVKKALVPFLVLLH